MGAMSAQPYVPGSRSSPERIRESVKDDRSPRALRAVLPVEDHAAFDEEYRAALDEARDTYDLAAVQRFQDRWWGIVMLKADPVEYRRVLDRAEELQGRADRGEAVGGVPWDEGYAARLRSRQG